MYHYWAADGSWKLLDGDKIAALYASFVIEQVTRVTGVTWLTHVTGVTRERVKRV